MRNILPVLKSSGKLEMTNEVISNTKPKNKISKLKLEDSTITNTKLKQVQ